MVFFPLYTVRTQGSESFFTSFYSWPLGSVVEERRLSKSVASHAGAAHSHHLCGEEGGAVVGRRGVLDVPRPARPRQLGPSPSPARGTHAQRWAVRRLLPRANVPRGDAAAVRLHAAWALRGGG